MEKKPEGEILFLKWCSVFNIEQREGLSVPWLLNQ